MANAFAILLLVLGIACQFLLTAEKFTAGIQGIVCLVVSLLFCVYIARRYPDDDEKQKQSVIIATIAVVMLLVHALQLPQNYHHQQELHRTLENTRAWEARQAEEQLEAD